jgi:hypothetical protein
MEVFSWMRAKRSWVWIFINRSDKIQASKTSPSTFCPSAIIPIQRQLFNNPVFPSFDEYMELDNMGITGNAS